MRRCSIIIGLLFILMMPVVNSFAISDTQVAFEPAPESPPVDPVLVQQHWEEKDPEIHMARSHATVPYHLSNIGHYHWARLRKTLTSRRNDGIWYSDWQRNDSYTLDSPINLERGTSYAWSHNASISSSIGWGVYELSTELGYQFNYTKTDYTSVTYYFNVPPRKTGRIRANDRYNLEFYDIITTYSQPYNGKTEYIDGDAYTEIFNGKEFYIELEAI